MSTDLQTEEQTDEQTELQTKPTVQRLRISRTMYMEMLDAGVITEDQRIQLIDGEIYEMSPIYNPHWIAVGRLRYLVSKALPADWSLGSQDPLVISTYSEPEPDLMVFRGSIMSLTEKATANQTPLVVEVSDSTLAFDRGKKQTIYAEAGIPEYWIVNLVDRVIEVYTKPQPRSNKSRGKYAAHRNYQADEKITIRLEDKQITEFTVGDLFI